MLTITDSNCRAFFDHWRHLPRGPGGFAPLASAYLDHAPPALMPSTFIHEIVDDGLLIRFMGTQLVERWQRDDTGKVFGGHLDQEARARLVTVAKTIVEHPCGMLQHGIVTTTAARRVMFEAVLLPLRADADHPPRVVIYSAFLDRLARKEHGGKFAAAGERCWLDIGAGVPSIPPPPG
ncbi:MAG: PAS domain-containing protein [Rhodospirillaceae bacterium]|nr:PAS domain-containing protein [Rhodospirillaceae bacterium]